MAIAHERRSVMLQFNNVLCPIDFSETSIRALTYATALARWYDTQLEVLHVVPAFDHDGPPTHCDVAGGTGPSREQLIVEIERAISTAGASRLKSRALAEEGRAHEIIVCRARVLPADLLVMGTHGRSGVNRLLLGSVTEKVLRQVECPVLTVPPAAPVKAEGPVAFKKILCAIDYSPSALKALQYALGLGRQADGCVTALYAVEYADPEEAFEPSPFDPCHQAIAESRRRRQALIEHARRRLHTQLAEEPTTWCEIEEIVMVDRACKAILGCANEVRADLIVMGSQGTGGIELLLYGSNTQHVLRAASCPVLTVKA
jgi:nucleotide-binding universal stress UspA family protein